MLVSAEIDAHGQLADQHAFSVVHTGDPGRVYCLGVEAPTGVLAVWLDPYTGKPTFGCYLTIQDAVHQLSHKLNGVAPLELVMDEREDEPHLEMKYEEIILVKAVVRRVCERGQENKRGTA